MQQRKLDTNTNEKCELTEEVRYVPVGDREDPIFEAETVQKSDTFFLYFIVLTGTLPLLVGGTELVWMSPVLATLQSNNTKLNPLDKPITVIETSMLAATPCLFGLVGALVLPKIADHIGRKTSLLISAAAILVLYVGKGFCHRVSHLIIYRTGLFTFISYNYVIIQVYIKEVCEDHNRAKFLCLMNALYPLGNLYAYALGPFFSFRDFNIYCTLPIVPFLIMFTLAPESPFFLCSKGKIEECKNALRKLRSNKSRKELELDLKKIEETSKLIKADRKASLISLLKMKESRIGLMLVIFLVVSHHCTGVAVISAFLEPMLRAAGTIYSETTMTLAVGTTQVVALFLTSFVVEKAGRKVLLMISYVACSGTLFVFGLFYYLKEIGSPIISQVQWLPIVCVIAFYISFAIGVGSVSLTVVSELFTSELITVAVSVAITLMNATVVVLAFLYPIMADRLGVHWCIWMYSLMSIAGAGLVYKILPETKGKSSLEIQEILRNY